MKNKENLIDIEPNHLVILKNILKRFTPYKQVWAYGSRVNWTAGIHSDLDLVVFDVQSNKITELKEAFEESDIPFRVDVMDWDNIPLSFKDNIMKKYVVVQEKPQLESWKECKLGDVVNFGNGKIRPKSVGNVPVYGGNGILEYCNEFNYSDKTIIIGRVGAYCGSIYFEKNPIWVSDNALAAKVKEKNNTEFFYYFLKNLNLNTYAEGSSHPLVTQTILNSIDIIIPNNFDEQRAIAAILSSLDDKIDLLHRQNKTLEAMAETLFRQWFVEEASENETVPISEFAVNIRQNAQVDELKNYQNYVGLEHIPRKSITLSSWGIPDSLESNKSIFIKNDILFGKLRSYFHKVVFAPTDGICSTDILVIRPKKKEWFSFCLFWFFNKDVVEHSDLGSGGTRMPRTNWEIISNYKIPKPDEKRIIEFETIAHSKIDRIAQNVIQIRTLEKLRDNLLPKLMSGEVRVAV